MAYHINFKKEKCVGCYACVVACMDENNTDPNKHKHQTAWRHIRTLEKGDFPEVELKHETLVCRNCKNAPCQSVCASGAISRHNTLDVILVNSELCIGCKKCLTACPWNVPSFGPSGKMEKCQSCYKRVEIGLEPACVRVCPNDALLLHNVKKGLLL